MYAVHLIPALIFPCKTDSTSLFYVVSADYPALALKVMDSSLPPVCVCFTMCYLYCTALCKLYLSSVVTPAAREEFVHSINLLQSILQSLEFLLLIIITRTIIIIIVFNAWLT